MTIEERKQKTYKGLQLLEKDITRLQNNISELKQILEDIHTEEDIEKYSDFDLEKGLDIIELF